MTASIALPFEEFPIVLLRPEQRLEEGFFLRFWRLKGRRIIETRYLDTGPPTLLWKDEVAGWEVTTNLLCLSDDGRDEPKFNTVWYVPGSWHSAVAMTQAKAYANHHAKVQEIADDFGRLQAHRRQLGLKFPFGPEMVEWIREHAPFAKLMIEAYYEWKGAA